MNRARPMAARLIIVKIYNQIENTVLRICLLDRAYKSSTRY